MNSKPSESTFEKIQNKIKYSENYCDKFYEYRHVTLPPELAILVPKNHLMTETDWRNLGIRQSRGWRHYMSHSPEPHVILFRRLLPRIENMEIA